MSSLWVFLAQYAIWSIFLVPVTLALRGQRHLALTTALAVLLAWASSRLIKDFFYWPRPYLVQNQPVLVKYLLDGSFPSLHTAVAFAASLAVYRQHRSLGAAMLILSGFIGVSRIVVGVHAPLDILGGMAIAALINWGSKGLDNLFFRKEIQGA